MTGFFYFSPFVMHFFKIQTLEQFNFYSFFNQFCKSWFIYTNGSVKYVQPFIKMSGLIAKGQGNILIIKGAVMKKLFLLFVLTIFCIASIAAVNYSNYNNSYTAYDTKDSKEFTVKPGGKLEIELKTGGDIKIEGWNKDVVSIEIEISGESADNVKYDFEQSGNTVTITTEYKKRHRSNNTDASLIVRVPNKFNIDFSTMGGDIKIASVEGKIEGKTMGGDLNLNNLKGHLDITTMGGEIILKDSEVDGKAKTMGGEVTVENVQGDIDASSMGGNVQYSNVKGNKNATGKEVNISTMGGDLDVDKAPNGARLKTMGGDIKVNQAEKFITAETYGGDIEIKEIDGWVKAKTLGGDVTVTMTGDGKEGGRDVTLTSLSGDITLTVPAGLSMEIEIELAYTKKHTDCKIVSDFNINQERTDEWDDEQGTPRKYIYGKGSINGGKNKIIIHTINGNIYLKKG